MIWLSLHILIEKLKWRKVFSSMGPNTVVQILTLGKNKIFSSIWNKYDLDSEDFFLLENITGDERNSSFTSETLKTHHSQSNHYQEVETAQRMQSQ